MITAPLCGGSIESELEKTPAISLKDDKEPANRFVLWGVTIMFIGVAVAVIGKMLVHEEIISVAGILFSLAGMFLTAYPYLSPSRRKKHTFSGPSQPEVLTQSEPSRYLPTESNNDYVPSVTERTTNLLRNPTASKPEDLSESQPKPRTKQMS